MGRYWLFIWSTYYPSGGMNDFVNSFDDYDDACNAAKQSEQSDTDRFQIFDSQEGVEVNYGRVSDFRESSRD